MLGAFPLLERRFVRNQPLDDYLCVNYARPRAIEPQGEIGQAKALNVEDKHGHARVSASHPYITIIGRNAPVAIFAELLEPNKQTNCSKTTAWCARGFFLLPFTARQQPPSQDILQYVLAFALVECCRLSEQGNRGRWLQLCCADLRQYRWQSRHQPSGHSDGRSW